MTDVQELTKTVDGIIAEMATIRIDDESAMQTAGQFLKRNKETQKFVKEWFEDERAKTYEAYKAVTDQIRFFIGKLEKAEKAVKRKVADYQMEQEKKRRYEARLLEAVARKREEERRLQKALETGDEEILEKPVDVPTVTIDQPRSQEGITYVEKWTYEIQDVNQIPREYMVPDERKIRQVVTAMKEKANIPGVRIYSDKTVRVAS